jgi:hypothetical protein
MLSLRVAAVAALMSTTPGTSALAWGPQGHALIGEIADQVLAGTPTATKVNTILGPYTLQEAAKWPDCVRSVHRLGDGSFKFVHDKYTDACTAFMTPAETARMEDYARRNWDTFKYRAGHGDHEAYHFADIPIEDGSYAPSDIGASDHDVVHAINAAIAELQHRPVPAPFSIKDDKEAILLLAHFIGDVHQPLHVGAIYLDSNGGEVNPPSPAEAETDSTAGGNFIRTGQKKSEMHAEWDSVPTMVAAMPVAALVAQAKKVPATPGAVTAWSVVWASESVVAAAKAYGGGITYADEGAHEWRATFQDRKAYLEREHVEQETRIVQAGARLASVLKAVLP